MSSFAGLGGSVACGDLGKRIGGRGGVGGSFALLTWKKWKMKLAYENLEIWQLGMELVELVYSLREKFPPEDKFGLRDQLVRSTEAIPRAIAEGYVKSSNKERVLYIERAKSETAETDTSFKEAVKKKRITSREYKTLAEPLIRELYFNLIGYRKWLLKEKLDFPKANADQPSPPRPRQTGPIPHLNQGFTLIEILVAFGILGIITVMGTNMFFTILKGSAKTRVLTEVKQNGDYAINVMERRIRNAKSLSGGGNSVVIVNPDDSSTTFGCSGGEITLDGESLISEEVKVEDGDCPSVFTVTAGVAGARPVVVVIDFTLQQAGADIRPEAQATIDFGTTVSLRNY